MQNNPNGGNMFGYDEELPAGFQDADFEQRDFEEQSARFASRERNSAKLRAEGNLPAAAKACPHGWGWPLDSLAAEHENDPNAGEDGWRCGDCGSRLDRSAFDNGMLVVPCEVPPFRG
jgi:hypothetical protein